jgi:Transketolase, C-terminal domain
MGGLVSAGPSRVGRPGHVEKLPTHHMSVVFGDGPSASGRRFTAPDYCRTERDVSIELIDPRRLVPFDLEAVARSLDRTNRLVVVHEAPAGGSWGATLIAALLQDGFETLDAPRDSSLPTKHRFAQAIV